MEKDSDYRKLIHKSRWLRLRKSVLSAHPLCESCEVRGEITPATEVHHVTPVSHGVTLADKERLMFNPLNLRALCHGCHVAAHMEMGRSGKAAAKRISSEHVDEINRRLYGE